MQARARAGSNGEKRLFQNVWQVKLTDGADGLDGSGKEERGIMDNS